MRTRQRPYMMAHPTWRTRDYRLAALTTIALTIIIVLAGHGSVR